MREEQPEASLAISILKYFIHGILFSLLAAGLVLVGTALLVFLAILGLGGILLVIAILYIIPLFIGAANCVITGFLWFPVKYSWLGTWGHGVLLLICMIIVNLIISIPLSAIPQTAAIIIGFIIGAFVDGFIGKQIAGIWREEEEEQEEET
jgi:hypothetical protein